MASNPGWYEFQHDKAINYVTPSIVPEIFVINAFDNNNIIL